MKGKVHSLNLLTAKAVAKCLSVGYGSVLRLVREGHLPAFKVGPSYVFCQEDVEALIERSTVYPTQSPVVPSWMKKAEL